MTTKCYFDQTDGDGCMTYEANELAEYCVKLLSVSMAIFQVYSIFLD